MRFSRYPVLIGVTLLLAGCAQVNGGFAMFDRACKAPNRQHLAGVDWDQARKINLRIRQDTFTPTYIGLIQGAPYRLMIENADDSAHVFRAMEFFDSVEVSDVRVISGPGAGVDKGYTCSGAISIAPGGVAEARFVSVRDGVYQFDGNPVLLSFVKTGSAGGFIVIEPKRMIPESPVKHLKFLQRKKLRTSPVSAPSGGLFDDPPASEQSAPEQPVDAAPAVPVEELPVEELPTSEVPVSEMPIEEKPVEVLPEPKLPTISGSRLDQAPAADIFSD